jgi:Tfp pilus assembly protein PilZ
VSDKVYSERRRHERIKVTFFIHWGFDAVCSRQARITSLSVGGCFVQTADAAETGQRVFLRMALPEERVLPGEVRYHMPEIGFGLMFVDMTVEERQIIQSLIEHYKQ